MVKLSVGWFTPGFTLALSRVVYSWVYSLVYPALLGGRTLCLVYITPQTATIKEEPTAALKYHPGRQRTIGILQL